MTSSTKHQQVPGRTAQLLLLAVGAFFLVLLIVLALLSLAGWL